jgi:hypothetical protein
MHRAAGDALRPQSFEKTGTDACGADGQLALWVHLLPNTHKAFQTTAISLQTGASISSPSRRKQAGNKLTSLISASVRATSSYTKLLNGLPFFPLRLISASIASAAIVAARDFLLPRLALLPAALASPSDKPPSPPRDRRLPSCASTNSSSPSSLEASSKAGLAYSSLSFDSSSRSVGESVRTGLTTVPLELRLTFLVGVVMEEDRCGRRGPSSWLSSDSKSTAAGCRGGVAPFELVVDVLLIEEKDLARGAPAFESDERMRELGEAELRFALKLSSEGFTFALLDGDLVECQMVSSGAELAW